ncbi:MAG: NAD(P)-dependent oxidoreductase [Candidatus Omnitrophica bacterium]|nr:NAD(P)-dependent oxidoreductase [Candidatus Omnitrophota bacterium]
MKILITGSNGFIGQAVTERLRKRHKVFTLGRDRQQDYCCDLRQEQQVRRIGQTFKAKKIDFIIHLASVICTPQNRTQISLLEENLLMTKNMIVLAQMVKPKAFIHASSIAMYPQQNGTYSEKSVVNMSGNGDGLYGLAKFNAEVLLNFFLSSTMKVVHLRVAQVIGPLMREDRIIPMMLKELKEKNTITVFGNGERVVNFIHVRDVARAFEKISVSPKPGSFNVGCRKHWTILAIAKELARQYGNKDTKIIKVPQGSRIKQYIDTNLLKETYAFEADTLDLSSKGLNV